MASCGFGTDEDQSVVAENRLRARREFSAHPGRYAAIVEADRKQGIGQAPGAWKLQIGILSEKRSEEHTSELQSLMRISYAVFCLKKKKSVKLRPHTIPLLLQTNIVKPNDT